MYDDMFDMFEFPPSLTSLAFPGLDLDWETFLFIVYLPNLINLIASRARFTEEEPESKEEWVFCDTVQLSECIKFPHALSCRKLYLQSTSGAFFNPRMPFFSHLLFLFLDLKQTCFPHLESFFERLPPSLIALGFPALEEVFGEDKIVSLPCKKLEYLALLDNENESLAALYLKKFPYLAVREFFPRLKLAFHSQMEEEMRDTNSPHHKWISSVTCETSWFTFNKNVPFYVQSDTVAEMKARIFG